MCAAIDATLGAISSGTVHSCIGACDPRGLFAKHVLNGDSHHALAITSLSYLIQKKLIYACGTAKPNDDGDAPTSLGVGCAS